MKNQQATYSIIIPHFNDPIRLERMLHSVPVERENVEVIVVDDCSPDQKTLEAIRGRWRRVRWLLTPENAGAGVARNVGLDAATGRWLVFADSDDEFLPGAFEIFDEVLREDDQLVYFLAEAVQEADGSPSVRAESMNALVIAFADTNDKQSLQSLRLHHVNPVAKVYSRAFVESKELRFDPIRRSNDIAFNVLAAVQVEHLRVDLNTVYRIYRRSESLTADISAAAFMERFIVNRSLAQRLSSLSFVCARPATGQMLMSLRYGPRTALRVWWLAMRSPMQIEWLRIFDIQRWRKFISNYRAEVNERHQ